jgi:hypothetical protein
LIPVVAEVYTSCVHVEVATLGFTFVFAVPPGVTHAATMAVTEAKSNDITLPAASAAFIGKPPAGTTVAAVAAAQVSVEVNPINPLVPAAPPKVPGKKLP